MTSTFLQIDLIISIIRPTDFDSATQSESVGLLTEFQDSHVNNSSYKTLRLFMIDIRTTFHVSSSNGSLDNAFKPKS